MCVLAFGLFDLTDCECLLHVAANLILLFFLREKYYVMKRRVIWQGSLCLCPDLSIIQNIIYLKIDTVVINQLSQ